MDKTHDINHVIEQIIFFKIANGFMAFMKEQSRHLIFIIRDSLQILQIQSALDAIALQFACEIFQVIFHVL